MKSDEILFLKNFCKPNNFASQSQKKAE